MIRVVIISLILVSLAITGYAQSEPEYKDPFEPLLPEEEADIRPTQRRSVEDDESYPPAISIEGVLWGTLNPSTIIDGEVYKVGDAIKGVGAQVFKIEKNDVFISYGEKIYKMQVQKKEAR